MHEYTSGQRIWELTCPGRPEEVGRVRRWTRDVLDDSACADDAALIVSELGSNALLHTASGTANGIMHISLYRSFDTVILTVTDTGGGHTKPRPVAAAQEDTNGRGLSLVSALARHIEVSGDDTGRTVTVEMDDEAAEPKTRTTPTARRCHR